MKRSEIINFLNSQEIFDKVLGIISHKALDEGSVIDDYPLDYFIAGGSVANTIYHLLNPDKFDKPIINDVDLFSFTINNIFYFSPINTSDFISPFTVNESLGLDGYGRSFLGAKNEYVRMNSSERFGVINKVSLSVSNVDPESFNETDYYKQLLNSFDLNCCMAGLDRVNNKIIYTEGFVDFLLTDSIEITNLDYPLQTTVRFFKKGEELGTDTSNFDTEISLIQHSFLISGRIKSIGPEWMEKTRLNKDLVLKYFSFNTEQNDTNRNIFSYTIKDFDCNEYTNLFYIGNSQNLITFWDLFVRKKKVWLLDKLIAYYKTKKPESFENLVSKKYSEHTIFSLSWIDSSIITILTKVPNYFDYDFTIDQLNEVMNFNKFLSNELFLDQNIFLVDNIKDQIKMINYVHKRFFNQYGVFKSELFNKVLFRVINLKDKNKNLSSFEYIRKKEVFDKVLNDMWVKYYTPLSNKIGLKHKFVVKK